jgi:hypothetical protein
MLEQNSNKIFYANGSAWQAWNKPTSAKSVRFFLIGGGGGGGGGRTSALNSSTGGGGGGSSSVTILKVPANLLPDVLYIQVGLGGIGGAAGSAGTSGTLSYISFQPDTTAFNILAKSGDAAATGGGGGGSSVAGTGGTAGTVFNYTSLVFGQLGMVTSIAGQNGGNGTTIGGTIVNITPALPVTGGAGGGGTSSGGTTYNAGSITGSGFLPTISGGGNGVLVAGDDGFKSLPNLYSKSKQPMFFTGGAGGSSNNGGSGGAGGNASYGSGGGGGGGTYQGGTGGIGGKGGDGLVIITTE